MTRETKIGLLIGLGFIVVFAVLLSHTSSSPTVGDGMPVASRLSGPGESLSGRPLIRTDADGLAVPSNGTSASGRSSDVATGHPGVAAKPATPTSEPRRVGVESPLANGLPTPDVFGSSPGDWVGSRGPGTLPLNGSSSPVAGAAGPLMMVETRVAPPLPQKTPQIEHPQPTARPEPPTATPEPEPKPEKQPKALPGKDATPKEYLVQKGDTLRKIAKASYGTSSTKAVEFLAASNKSRIKDMHTVIEGQKLAIPPLPPELAGQVEPVPSFDVSRSLDGTRTVSSDDLSGSAASGSSQRRAPVAARNDAAEKPGDKAVDKTGDKTATSRGALSKSLGRTNETPSKTRTYEIQVKDTLGSIAAQELGSATRWQEIKKLNQDLDPTKMRPGMKIRLPGSKEPVSGKLVAKRVSA